MRTRGYVYANGEMLAWQETSLGDHVRWEHRDPSSASVRATFSNGGLDNDREAELDPHETSVFKLPPIKNMKE